MSKYINVVIAAEKISEKHNIPLSELVDTFAEIPSADVVEVMHGEWIIKNDEKDWRDKDYYRLVIKCSICGKSHFLGTTKYRNEYDEEKLKELGNIGDYSYCGKCGAKMDGKDGEK